MIIDAVCAVEDFFDGFVIIITQHPITSHTIIHNTNRVSFYIKFITTSWFWPLLMIGMIIVKSWLPVVEIFGRNNFCKWLVVEIDVEEFGGLIKLITWRRPRHKSPLITRNTIRLFLHTNFLRFKFCRLKINWVLEKLWWGGFGVDCGTDWIEDLFHHVSIIICLQIWRVIYDVYLTDTLI